VITMIMAGADSTATVLAWAMVELSENPERFAQLRGEAKAALGRDGFSRDAVRNLPLLMKFWQEMCGKYPAFPLYFRGVTAELQLGRFTLPANAEIVIIPGATAPFGLGERQCIGRNFATVTALDALAIMLQNVSHLHRDSKYGDRRVRFAMTAPPLRASFWIALGV
ncbi:MAG TPA: cytochrome P450, partial [Candidatus Saccharimonadales bacterium]